MARSGSSGSAALTATRRRACRIGTIRGEWQCVRYARGGWRHVSHCHLASSVPHWYDQGRVAVRPVRSGGVAARLTLPLGVERAALVRSGPSGSACWPGRTPDPQPSRRLESDPTGQMRSGDPPPSRRGSRQSPQASAWGLTARKGAVWAEGLADGAPWARPGHHQAASCGLRGCRELRLRQGPEV